MNPRYRETYSQHRWLFLSIIAVAGAVALWINLAAPKTYRSSTSLWSDIAGGSASQAIGAPPPAAQEQSTLNELLRTQLFRNTVARRSGLAAYLRQHPSEGSGPKALLKRLSGPPSVDDRVAAALSAKLVTSTVEGPHVLKINFDGPTPALAYKTLATLVDEYRKQRSALQQDALTLYSNQVGVASRALSDARANLSTYLRDHSSASRSDPQLVQLSHTERNAVMRLADATDTLNQASTALNPAAVEASLQVIDPAELPTHATVGKKKLVVGLFAGLFAGLVTCLLGVVALTKLRGDVHEVTAEATVVRDGPKVRTDESFAESDAMAVAHSSDIRRRRSRSG
jgi:uncharacterized protein involved in exopolysaccharide biosynthesis